MLIIRYKYEPDVSVSADKPSVRCDHYIFAACQFSLWIYCVVAY